MIRCRRLVASLALVTSAVVSLLVPAAPAQAADIGDIIDGFSRADDDVVDFSLTAAWDMQLRSGKILREFRCLAHDTISGGGADLCPNGSQVVLSRELTAQRTTHVFNIDAAVAFWRFALIRVRVPIVLSDETRLDFDDGVTPTNSTVDPYNVPSLFSVPHSGQSRMGVMDPSLWVRFAPLSFAEDQLRPTWSIDVGVTTAFVPVRKGDNTHPGEGVWKVDLGTSLAARLAPWVEPWFRAGGRLRFGGGSSLFKDYGATQTLVHPGSELKTSFGVQFVPWEDRQDERGFYVDVGAGLDYRFEGREYTDLFEALATSGCDPRDASEPCDLTTFDRGDVDPATGKRRKSDGVTDVEQYATIRSHINVRYQPIKYVVLRAGFNFAYELPHYLTFADAGRDLDGVNDVQPVNSQGFNEFNPVYAEAFDSLGSRFRSGGAYTYGVTLSVEGKF